MVYVDIYICSWYQRGTGEEDWSLIAGTSQRAVGCVIETVGIGEGAV